MTNDGGNLKRTAAKGFLWGGFSNGICQLLSLLFGIYLANILGPNDYGPIGMLAIFSAIAGSLQESGFVAALANLKRVTHADYNAVFWFNIFSSLLLYVLLYVAAPLIADYYHEPILVPLSRYSFLGFVVAGFGIAPAAYLFRELMVREKSIAIMLSIFVSGSVGIFMAYKGYSYWGIATQGILYVGVKTLCSWYFSPWRPSWHINLSPLGSLFSFSSRLLITNLFLRINGNVFSFVLGGSYSRVDVGFYTKANEWNNMGSETVNGMVNGVAQPILSRVREDGERQLRVFRKMVRFTACIAFPLLFGLALVAPELIEVTITEKWLVSGSMLQVLCIWGAFIPIQSLCTNLLISRGRSRIYMWSTVVQGLLLIALLFSLHSMGIRFMLYAFVALNILWLGVWRFFVGREIGLTLFMFLRDLMPFILLSLAIMAVVYLLTLSIASSLVLLLARILLAGSLYLLSLYVGRFPEFRETMNYFSSRK